jgi:uncharacterized membrane-anchored protein
MLSIENSLARSYTMKNILNRVPEIVFSFWVIKILATTVGETAADYLSETMNFGLANTSYVMSGILLLVLLNQFRLKRYIPVSYWIVVVLMSITGTLITDRLVEELNFSLASTTILFSIGLSIVFATWYANEKTLAMHSIHTPQRELFYWAAILLTFALGTATGDLLAEAMKLGYGQSAIIFGVAIAVIFAAYHYLKLNSVLAFWLAYVLTRPLGASIGDLLSQPAKNGGYGLSTTGTSILFLSIITSLIIYLSLKQKRNSLTID